MWWDSKFSLLQDGDELEQLWWPLLASHFPQYENFWIKHIVPLTNRIDPDCSPNQHFWPYFRSDPRIAEAAERMTMAHYSTFYCLARSTLMILCEPHLYVEDAFVFLNLTVKHVWYFLGTCRGGLATSLGLDPNSFPDHSRMFNLPFAREIHTYKNVMGHFSKIGRGQNLSKDYLPKVDHLDRGAKRSWRYVQALPDGEFVEARTLLRHFLSELTKEICARWMDVDKAMEPARVTQKYQTCMGLDQHYCIPGKTRSR
jgi:hypothetical protein